ncbi:MAG TPA: hypothetical protein DCR97_11145 [Deltaproteobacteria bacterium]|nr:hypothetical protein [Deltaproteobacteria bacterium]
MTKNMPCFILHQGPAIKDSSVFLGVYRGRAMLWTCDKAEKPWLGFGFLIFAGRFCHSQKGGG